MKDFIKTNWIVIAIVCFFLTGSFYAMLKTTQAEPLDTYHSSWHIIRADATEDAADFATALPLATSEGNFANKPSGAFRIVPTGGWDFGEGYSPGSKWMFAFCGDHEDGDTFSFNLIGWARLNGMAQVICEGNGTLGAQDVVIQPDGTADANGFWADTIALDEETKWPGTSIGDTNGVHVSNSGDNQVAVLIIETTGLEWIQFIVYDAAGGAECATVAVYGRRY